MNWYTDLIGFGLIKAIGYALTGLRTAWINEVAFRREILLFIILIPLAFWLGANGVEQALLISSLLLILIAELLNSAIEAVADSVSQEWHQLLKNAKDLGAAAVLVAFCTAVLIWGLVLWPLINGLIANG